MQISELICLYDFDSWFLTQIGFVHYVYKGLFLVIFGSGVMLENTRKKFYEADSFLPFLPYWLPVSWILSFLQK